jgi:hypothetical protein
MADPQADLQELTDELARAAARLRAGELDADGAAALVDECARLAARAAAELDRQARAAEPSPGQDSLLS